MRNRITVGGHNNTVHMGSLPAGAMFRNVNCQSEENVYMKIKAPQYSCVLLTTGEQFSYPWDKEVIPVRRGQSVTITQGED